ncbi:hypothetical protein SAMN05444920_116104 [Nonomuraea solani]|uniref:PQQ-like domain-containing protein n=1 Tax=Nonomuraea solani TaxID=1144553 RepID=A0A1H6EU69_9ACTN|nr:hypothetical protein [Nonomuraea solani]SEH00369.1 hypothetical protein SAMN05444920_116104 [Nonomuraea solani]
MTKELEDDLQRVLGRAAEIAPQAPGGFSAHIARTSRRRRTRTLAVATALAAAVVAGGVTATVRGLDQGGTQIAVAPGEQIPDPVEKVWPAAVWKIPARLPDGGKFQPKLFIDDKTVLLETWESFEKANALYAYDLATGQVRKITDIRTRKGVYASNYIVGAGRVIWMTAEKKGTRFWSAPLEGGQPTAITTDTPIAGAVDKATVTGDRIAFSLAKGGVFTLPLTGGGVTPVAGAERHHILRWPWVGTPGPHMPDNVTSFEELLNAETGETSKAVTRPGEEFVTCGVTMCVGVRADNSAFHRLRDGSQERDLPGQAIAGLALDRFMTVMMTGATRGQALLDVTTGTSADLGLRPDAKGQMLSIYPGLDSDPLITYELDGRYVLIDLTRIG